MSATTKVLNLYDLLLPQFLAGFQFPDYIDKYLSLLAVADLAMASDDNSVLYTGTVFFPSKPGTPPQLSHKAPNGAVFDFNDVTLQFRLRVPRAGSSSLESLISSIQHGGAVGEGCDGRAGIGERDDDRRTRN